jgi:hypothetical protein
VTGLVPGLSYRWTAHGPAGTSAMVPETVAQSGKAIDLGDIVLGAPGP